MPRQSHSQFDHANNIWWRVQIMKSLIVQFSPLPCYLVPLRPKYSPVHPVPKHEWRSTLTLLTSTIDADQWSATRPYRFSSRERGCSIHSIWVRGLLEKRRSWVA
jgi:hypothetical protein